MLLEKVSPNRSARYDYRLVFTYFILYFVSCFFVQTVSAFDVIKNVNSLKPPVEKLVIFEKGKPTDHLSFVDDANCKLSFTPDGAIECRIVGNTEINPLIKWKAKEGLPAGFRLQDYDYVILTCRMEGTNKITDAKGTVSENRPANMYFCYTLFDLNGDRLGTANLADATTNGKTPDQTTVLKFPMILVRFWDQSKTGEVQAIGFPWAKTRSEINRDYRLIIDKIAVAVDATH